ncbi:hypothetical protein EK904_004019, partial [Melospiza melodia maxima]
LPVHLQRGRLQGVQRVRVPVRRADLQARDLQHQQRHQAVPRRPVPVRLLRRRDRLPQVPHRAAVLQRLHVLLARQLRHRAGPGDAGGRLRLLLLGLQEARRHAGLPALLRLRPRAP